MNVNPRILLPLCVLVLASLLLLDTPLQLLPALLWLPLGLSVSRMSARELGLALLGFRWMVALNLLFLLLLPLWGTTGWQGWVQTGLVPALFISVRLLLLLACSLIFARLAGPEDVLDVLELGAEPLARIGLPARRWVFTLTLAWRLLPVIQEESRWIERARRIRLATPPKGMARVHHLAGLALPVLQAALDRADDLQTALHCRACDPLTRPVSLRRFRLATGELLALALGLVWCAYLFALHVR
ncbi:MAG: energy-coupling factor transporter transmembrane protein EcfT [Candidatus Delongbacteria bacterium]|nr:energy-coupling factor transporter transmembrane protein EcfT [Candidatus Delongbacteria bacterium]